MNTARKAYVVRDADSDIPSGDVTQVYAYTLKGLTTALTDARLRSFGGIPQEVAVITDGKSTVIRRFDRGHEAPVTPLAHSATGWLALLAGGDADADAKCRVRACK